MEPEEPTATQAEREPLPAHLPASPTRLVRVLLGVGIFGMFGLSLLFNLPLAGVGVPFGLGTLLSAGVLLLCGLRFRDGSPDEKLAAGAVTLSLLHLASQKEIWNAPGSADVASLLAARLSTNTWGYPLLGVLYAWALLAAGLLTARAVQHLATAEGLSGRATRWTAIFTGALVSLFGLRGLIGYVTGSTSFFG